MPVTPLSELERLLDDDRWIRRLAGRLVADPATAEDLAQEAWVAALGSAGSARVERRWLGRVLRNSWKDLLRGRERRVARERDAARAEASEPADELVAELELRERVARALRELEEPFRRTLVLRYLRDESLSTIARSEGVAVSTIHERLEHGLARLRQRLDAEHGGRRSAWALTLVGLARRGGGGGVGPVEILTMASGLKVAVAVVVVASAAALWWKAREPAAAREADEARPLSAQVAVVGERTRPEVLPEPAAAAREEQAALAAPSSEPLPEPVFHGHVLETSGVPVPGVELIWNDELHATSTADGSFSFPGEKEAGWKQVRCLDPRYLTLIAGALHGEECLVIVAPTRDFAGRVLDESGAPIEGAELEFRPRASLFPALGLQVSAAAVQATWNTESDAAGRFELPGLAGGPHVGLEVRALGFVSRSIDLPESGDGNLSVVLALDKRTRRLAGRVLGPDGAPFAGARVSAGQEIVVSGADGSFRLVAHPDTGMYTQDEHDVWRPEPVETVRVIALAPEHGPGIQEFAYEDPPEVVLLQLGAAPLSISGHVLDPEGLPIPGVILWPRALTPFGNVPRGMDGIRRDLEVEGELCGGSGSFGTVSAEDGAFTLGCLIDRAYDLELFDARTASRRSVEGVRAGTSGLELVLAPEPETRRVAGRVLSAGGEPRPSVMVKPRRAGAENGQPPQLLPYWRETDAEGRFEFESLATADTILDVFTLPWQRLPLADLPDLEHIEIVVPLLCELQVVLRETTLADALGVLDAHGAPLEVVERIHMDGQSVAFSMDARAEFTDGRSSVLQVPETARTLVLYQGDAEVLRLPLELDPHQPTVVRP